MLPAHRHGKDLGDQLGGSGLCHYAVTTACILCRIAGHPKASKKHYHHFQKKPRGKCLARKCLEV